MIQFKSRARGKENRLEGGGWDEKKETGAKPELC